MSQLNFVRDSLRNLHNSMSEATDGLTEEQAHWRPGDRGNHIGFIAWHYTRTVDNMVRYVLQRKPTVWMEGQWDQMFGLDSKAQGTGMSAVEAVDSRIADIPAFVRYMSGVWDETQAYLATVAEDELGKRMTIRPLGELTLEEVLGNVLLTHGYTHLGEIWLLRGLQGLRGNPL